MKRVQLLAAAVIVFLSVNSVLGDVGNEDAYEFLTELKNIHGIRKLEELTGEKTGWQDISYSGSKEGTTEFLIVSFSHGNPSCDQMIHIHKHKVQGGGWEKAVTAGNDDKSIEIWVRVVTSENINDLGQLEAGGAGSVKPAVVVYNGTAEVTDAADVKQCATTTIAINSNGAAPYLVAAASDNGTKESDRAMFHFAPGDDRVFVYLTTDKNFKDNTTGNLRGAIASLALADVETAVSQEHKSIKGSAPISISNAGYHNNMLVISGAENQSWKISLRTFNGKLIRQFSGQGNAQISSQLAPGMYVIRNESGSAAGNERLMVSY